MTDVWQPRESDEYPYEIQQAGPVAQRVFDRVEQGLLNDGYSLETADMMLHHSLDQILKQAKQEAAPATATRKSAPRKSAQRPRGR